MDAYEAFRNFRSTGTRTQQQSVDSTRDAFTVFKHSTGQTDYVKPESTLLKHDTGNKYTTYAPETIKTLSELQQDPLSLKGTTLNPVTIGGEYVKGIKDSFVDAWDQSGKVVDNLKEGNYLAAGGNFLLDLVKVTKAAISPVTSLFGAAEKVPVVGSAAKVFSLPFELAGDVANDASYPIINAIPGLDKQQRESLRSGVSETLSLAAQVAVGYGLNKGGKMAEAKFNELSAKYGPQNARIIADVAQQIVDGKLKAPPPEAPKGVTGFNAANPIDTPIEVVHGHFQKIQNMLNDPDLGPEAAKQVNTLLPSLKVDIVDGLKSYKFDKLATEINKIPINSATTFDTFKFAVDKAVSKVGQPSNLAIPPEITRVAETTKLTPEAVKGRNAYEVFKEKISETSQKVRTEATKIGIEIPENVLARVEEMKLADQAARARELIATDRAAAIERATTPEVTGGDIRTGAIFGELKKQALDTGDVNTLVELAKSKVGTEAAQSLKAFDVLSDQLRLEADPVQAIRDIREAKIEKMLEQQKEPKMTVEKIIAKEKASVPKVEKVKTQTWEQFINEITC